METQGDGGATAPTVGSIRVAASQFLRWAHDQGILCAEAYYPGEGVGQPEFEAEVSASALATLRNRQVRFVGVNELAQTISVFVRKAAPTAKELKALPRNCNGYALRYHQGNPNTVAPAAVAQSATSCALHTSGAGVMFYTCGSSISVGNDRAAGTLGCLVKDSAGSLFGLSNNHVSASCNYAPSGLPILAPGVVDVSPFSPAPFTLGTHTRQLPMLMGDPSSVDHTNNSDAAIFKLQPNAPVSSMQRTYYDTPTSVLDLKPGMTVQKVGRSSDLTSGLVNSEVIGALPISYSAAQYNFTGVVYFEPLFVVHGIGDRFSEAGDSGSLVTHVDAHGVRHAVGLVVAGCDDSSAPGHKRSFILPLRSILDRLQVTLVAGHNC